MPPKLELPTLPVVDLLGFRRITVVRHGLQDLEQHINFEEFRPKPDELCHYSEKGLSYSKGTAVDASFQESRKQRNRKEENDHIKETGKAPEGWSEKKKAHKDVDASWTQKGNERYEGYKNHTAVDFKTKIIRDYKVTTAKTHDSQLCEEIVPEDTQAVYADSAYMGKEREEALSKRNIKAHFVKHATRYKKLSEKAQKRNRRLAQTRAREEHVFGAIKQFYGDTVRYIGLERCGVRVGLVNLLYNMKRFCILRKSGGLCPVA